MHPRYLRELMDPGEDETRVFVAMSFAPHFSRRFEEVLAPAVAAIEANGVPLYAHRVDRTTISDSVVAEIIEGISRDLFVFVDISTIGYVDGRAVRNGNVMYELGLAHAIRTPEDVLVFRSDEDPLLFDVSGIRVNRYAPDDSPEAAREQVITAFRDALQYKRKMNRLAAERSVRGLDPVSIGILFRAGGLPMLGPPMESLEAGAHDFRLIPSFQHLLAVGLLRLETIVAMTPDNPGTATVADMVSFKLTKLGWDVLQMLLDSSGIFETVASLRPDMAALRLREQTLRSRESDG